MMDSPPQDAVRILNPRGNAGRVFRAAVARSCFQLSDPRALGARYGHRPSGSRGYRPPPARGTPARRLASRPPVRPPKARTSTRTLRPLLRAPGAVLDWKRGSPREAPAKDRFAVPPTRPCSWHRESHRHVSGSQASNPVGEDRHRRRWFLQVLYRLSPHSSSSIRFEANRAIPFKRTRFFFR